MIEKTCRDFIDVLASKEPVPGGGGASALAGAMAAALGAMVCNLTLGKKKYADVQADIEVNVAQCTALKDELLNLIEKDAELFKPLSEAYSLPRDTDEQKAHRDEVMEKCLRIACQAPIEIIDASIKCICVLEELADKGSVLAASDVGVGAVMAEAAIKGACLNVYINSELMKDKAFAKKLNDETIAKVAASVEAARALYTKVEKKFF